jgi:sigma-E factor negative regulatory protein RseC
MDEQAVVLEKGRGTARVRVQRSDACTTCGHCLFPDAGEGMTTEVVDRLGVSPGDLVKISTEGASPLMASLILFGVPIALLFGGYAAGAAVARAAGLAAAAQGIGVAAAVLFLAGSFLLISFVSKRLPGGRHGRSVIVEVLGRQEAR